MTIRANYGIFRIKIKIEKKNLFESSSKINFFFILEEDDDDGETERAREMAVTE